MPTLVFGLNSAEEQQQFNTLLETAKTTSGNIASFAFQDKFFKIVRNTQFPETNDPWLLYQITKSEFDQLSS
jgi:hypothetical protein